MDMLVFVMNYRSAKAGSGEELRKYCTVKGNVS
jgi:hypothetical protein